MAAPDQVTSSNSNTTLLTQVNALFTLFLPHFTMAELHSSSTFMADGKGKSKHYWKPYLSKLDQITDPDASVQAAVKSLLDLYALFTPRIENEAQRTKFVLASYNAGIGHVLDAIELASKNELDPQVWEGNVEEAILMKSNPQYYNDPVCRFGYCRGKETVNYVVSVEQRYNYYLNNFEEDKPEKKGKDKNRKHHNKH